MRFFIACNKTTFTRCAKKQQQYNLKLSQVSGDRLLTYDASRYQTLYKLGDGAWCSTGYVLQVLHAGEWTPT